MPDVDADPLSGRELAAFVAAAEGGSVHAAADSLGLTASAVTKRLQALERRAGVRLFDRGRFGLRPTDAARVLYPEAKHALSALAHASDALAEQRGQTSHVLALAASHTIGEFLLPGWLASFRSAYAGVRARVEIANSPTVIRQVEDHTADIGFAEGPEPIGALQALTVQRDELVAVVAAGHRWARRRAIDPTELRDEPYLAREQGSGTRATATAALAGAGIELVPALEFASTGALKRALPSGGFALLSELAVDSERRSATMHGLRVRGLDLQRELRALRDRQVALTGHTSTFWAWLERRAEEDVPLVVEVRDGGPGVMVRRSRR